MTLVVVNTDGSIEGEKPALLRLVAQEMRDFALSQVQAAREVGISSATLSQWLQGKYAGNTEAVAEKLVQWLEMREKRKATHASLPAAPAFLHTPTARKILDTLSFAQLTGDIACVYGAAGMGKSTTIRYYAEHHSNAWVVEMSTDCKGTLAALEEIALALGVRDMPSISARLRRELVARLRGTGGLLIIDEAQHLSIDALNCLRRIHENTWLDGTNGIGLVLCGNEVVVSRLTGGKRVENFAQLFSRIGKRLRIARPVAGDIGALVDHYAVSDPNARRMLSEIAANPGALRGVVKTLRLASMYAGRNPVDCEHIKAAWDNLGEAA